MGENYKKLSFPERLLYVEVGFAIYAVVKFLVEKFVQHQPVGILSDLIIPLVIIGTLTLAVWVVLK